MGIGFRVLGGHVPVQLDTWCAGVRAPIEACIGVGLVGGEGGAAELCSTCSPLSSPVNPPPPTHTVVPLSSPPCRSLLLSLSLHYSPSFLQLCVHCTAKDLLKDVYCM